MALDVANDGVQAIFLIGQIRGGFWIETLKKRQVDMCLEVLCHDQTIEDTSIDKGTCILLDQVHAIPQWKVAKVTRNVLDRLKCLQITPKPPGTDWDANPRKLRGTTEKSIK